MTLARRLLAVGVLVGATLLISVVAAEAALHLLPKPKTYRMLIPGTRIFEPDSLFFPGVHGAARYIVNRHGIRGPEFGADGSEYRVLFVGGSTTENGVLDEDENWDNVAERELGQTRDGRKLWFGNVGRSGLTSRDHVVTLKYLLPQHPKMDLVVVLVGVNDLTAALRQGTNYKPLPPLTDPDAEARQIRNAFAMSPGGLRELLSDNITPQPQEAWYRKTQLFQLARRARLGMQARQVVRGMGGSNFEQWRVHRRSASRLIDTLPDLSRPLADFRQNLELLVAQAKRANVELMLLTLPALWKKGATPAEERLMWLGGTGNFQEEPGHEYYTVAALAAAMAAYNATTLEVCRAHNLKCLDLAARVPQDTSMYYDDVHYTEKGSAKVGQLVAAHLRAAKPEVFR